MKELLDLLEELNKQMLEKMGRMKDEKYIKAIIEARRLISEAQEIIALAEN
jgi:hypothetical protein